MPTLRSVLAAGVAANPAAFVLVSALVSVLGPSAGCVEEFSDDIDWTDYQGLPALEDIDLAALTPAAPVDFIELRAVYGESPPESVAATGEPCAGASDPDACTAALAALTAPWGFDRGCEPGFCYKYLAVTRGDEVFAVYDRAGLAAWLAPVDTLEEALLMVSTEGFYWVRDTPMDGGVRAREDGYELIVVRLEGDCDPIETWRYLLHVDRAGAVTERARELRTQEYGACI
ncbi:hypothetical protein [Haliangium sp.]|uniref:hypothetical protein n=1 Tax=Haliangium sp. TaxID=2663208 RepID=UPI003D13F130